MQFWSTERRGAVEIATFSNPPYNYLDKAVIDELEQLVDDWREPSIRAVIIQSRPEDAGFFTQYSVEELAGLASDPAASRYAGALVRGYKVIFDRMTALPKVVIAAMNGDAMGGGFELTLACDLRIGERGDYRYGNPEVRAGVVPGAGGTQRVTRLVGLARALDWVLRGRIVRPEVALELGLIHELVDDAPARALSLAEELACLPPMAVANAKRSLYLGADSSLQAAFEVENMNWTEVVQSDDAKVALNDFLSVDPAARRDWFESENSKNYPEYSGH
ncbi:enoyl-CoA hydratase/isomerase family protein [Arthrobacter ramosus]|uniref:Enoyl-CoA hydratase/isomerase family protein n=1 Tax=Arthrobacter ramosus TaxID=1672 RepID=A0ABV5Y4Q5_ARTRM|nr:enoyl-CoA hydratase/isomerase family protein [Arthrobacter ramosus]